MEKEPNTCSTCQLYDDGVCLLHTIAVAENDESCNNYLEDYENRTDRRRPLDGRPEKKFFTPSSLRILDR